MNFVSETQLGVVHVPFLSHFEFPCSLMMFPRHLDYLFGLRCGTCTTLLIGVILSFGIMQSKNPRVVHVPLFSHYMYPSSDHCDKHLCFQGVVQVLLLLISNYLLNCFVASTCDNRGGACTTLAHFRICLFRCVVGNSFDLW